MGRPKKVIPKRERVFNKIKQCNRLSANRLDELI